MSPEQRLARALDELDKRIGRAKMLAAVLLDSYAASSDMDIVTAALCEMRVRVRALEELAEAALAAADSVAAARRRRATCLPPH